MTDDARAPLPEDLASALASRPDGDALSAVWNALPVAQRAANADDAAHARDAAWSRVRAAIRDADRVPYTDALPEMAVLVEDTSAAAEVHTTEPLRFAQKRSGPSAVRATAPSLHSATGRWLKAASLLLAAGIGGVAALRAIPVTYDAGAIPADGSTFKPTAIQLADGSEVWLAPGSKLYVPRSLGWPSWLRSAARDVDLNGSGFFAVVRDGRAFTVRTADAEVRVLGTRFEVRGPLANLGTQVTVQEGRVAVSATEGRHRTWPPVELRAGERTRVDSAPVATQLSTISAERIASWRTGGISTLDEPLDAVLSDLGRQFNVEITRAADIDGAATVSLFYPVAPPLQTVLSDLSTVQGFVFRRTSRGYQIIRSSK